eukprot:3938950-Rhodomonas_salina.1
MGQTRELSQHSRQTPRPPFTNFIPAQVKMSQPLALRQHPRQPPQSLVTNAVRVQVKKGHHRCELPQHPLQLCRSVRANHVPTE